MQWDPSDGRSRLWFSDCKFVLRSSGDTLSRENFYKLKARIAEARMLASGIHGRGGNVVDFDMPDDKEQEPQETEQGKH